jgi:acyl-CoA reductase-like NAD-dependent aldehyde dehydrogenase
MSHMTKRTSSQDLPIIPLWIDGSAISTNTGTSLFPVTNAKEGKVLHNAVSATPQSAVLACESASIAFRAWRKTSVAHRRALLLKAADVVERRAQEIISAQISETSCPRQFAGMNIKGGLANMREIAAATTQMRGVLPQRSTRPDGEEVAGLTMVVQEPVGVVLVIPP